MLGDFLTRAHLNGNQDTILQHSSMYILTTAEPAGEQHPKVPNSWGGPIRGTPMYTIHCM